MPIALFAALAGSLAIHLVGLFGTDVELFGGGPEPLPLQAEIRPPPPPPPPATPSVPPAETVKPVIKPARAKLSKSARAKKAPVLASAKPAAVAVPVEPEPSAEIGPEMPSTAVIASPALPPDLPATPPPAKAILPANGSIRFAIIKESLGLQVGRAEHHWEFSEDGRYPVSYTHLDVYKRQPWSMRRLSIRKSSTCSTA